MGRFPPRPNISLTDSGKDWPETDAAEEYRDIMADKLKLVGGAEAGEDLFNVDGGPAQTVIEGVLRYHKMCEASAERRTRRDNIMHMERAFCC